MTEAEWLACAEPERLIVALEGRASDRKLCLFAVAGCYLCKPRVRKPKRQFEVVVELVDGTGTREAVKPHWPGREGTAWPDRPHHWARRFAFASQERHAGYPRPAALVPLVRCIFGNPFRPVTFSPAWRTDTAVAIAKGMYESCDFSAMPILADALQDAGCEDEGLLTHCRAVKQPHARGCWVVDGVLGK